jgi:hypothetical protein
MIQPTVATIFPLDLPTGVRFDGVLPGHPEKLCFTLVQTDAQGGRAEDFTLDLSALTTNALRRFAAARALTATPPPQPINPS